MPLQSFVTADAILHLPSTSYQNVARNRQSPEIPPVYFFITGNPGLIGYYEKYLDILATTPSNPDAPEGNGITPSTAKATSSIQCVIAGFSLGGFEIGLAETSKESSSGTLSTSTPHGTGVAGDVNVLPQERRFGPDEVSRLAYPPSFERKEIYTLKDQVGLCYARLTYLVERVYEHYSDVETSTTSGEQGDNNDTQSSGLKNVTPSPVKVIIAGHSVGAYIALEVIRTHHEKSQSTLTIKSAPESSSSEPAPPSISFTVISALLLTPTIIDLSRSPSGVIATPLLTIIPSAAPFLLQHLSRGLATLLSRKTLEYAVHKVTGMSLDSAGLKTTTSFLSTRTGVKQALYMAGDELREMRENKWGDEIWGPSWTKHQHRQSQSGIENESESERKGGSESEGQQDLRKGNEWTAPRLFLIFAQTDHWVADSTRDSLLRELQWRSASSKTNGTSNGVFEPTVVVDEKEGLVHGWCLEQSGFMAGVTAEWIVRALRDHRG